MSGANQRLRLAMQARGLSPYDLEERLKEKGVRGATAVSLYRYTSNDPAKQRQPPVELLHATAFRAKVCKQKRTSCPEQYRQQSGTVFGFSGRKLMRTCSVRSISCSAGSWRHAPMSTYPTHTRSNWPACSPFSLWRHSRR